MPGSLRERDANKRFTLPSTLLVAGAEIGEGAFGFVRRAEMTIPAEWVRECALDDGDAVAEQPLRRSVAVKRIPNIFLDADTTKRVTRELTILMKFQRCPEVVGLFGAFVHRPPASMGTDDNGSSSGVGGAEGAGATDLYLLMDHLYGDLTKAIRKFTAPLETIRFMAFQLLLGLRALHRSGCIHRDLSSRNILITTRGDLFLSDFGLARFLDPEEELSMGVVTQWYRAPELLVEAKYDTKVDVWSVGVLLLELIVGNHVFRGNIGCPASQLNSIFDVLGTPTAQQLDDIPVLKTGAEKAQRFLQKVCSSPELKKTSRLGDRLSSRNDIPPSAQRDELHKLITGLLEFDPAKRLSADEALRSPFFNELKEDIVREIEEQDAVPPLKIEADQYGALLAGLPLLPADEASEEYQQFIASLRAQYIAAVSDRHGHIGDCMLDEGGGGV